MATTTDGVTAGEALTAETLAAMVARATAATAGPWENVGYFPGDCEGPHVEDAHEGPVAVCSHRGGGPEGDRDREGRANADFIAHARDDVPALLAEVRRLTAALDGVRREERERCKRECMVIAGELSYDFRLRQGMHAAERCAKAIGALPDDATGSAT